MPDRKDHYTYDAFGRQREMRYLDADGKKQTMKTYDYIKAELVKELTVRDSIAEALADTSDEGIIPQFKAAVKKSQEDDTGFVLLIFASLIVLWVIISYKKLTLTVSNFPRINRNSLRSPRSEMHRTD